MLSRKRDVFNNKFCFKIIKQIVIQFSDQTISIFIAVFEYFNTLASFVFLWSKCIDSRSLLSKTLTISIFHLNLSWGKKSVGTSLGGQFFNLSGTKFTVLTKTIERNNSNRRRYSDNEITGPICVFELKNCFNIFENFM